MNCATKTRGNALWALVHAAGNRCASEQRLVDLVEPLIAVFKQTDDDATCIINAAWAMTCICATRAAAHPHVVNVIARRDVFLHLSGLLRAQFPRPLEKLAIFGNVCRMLTSAINEVIQFYETRSRNNKTRRLKTHLSTNHQFAYSLYGTNIAVKTYVFVIIGISFFLGIV